MLDTTRERILEAATAIIRERGPEGLTVEATADRAGVSRKTVYNHFDGKYALIDVAAAAWMDGLLADLGAIAADASLPFVTKLNAIVERSYAELKSRRRPDGSGSMAASLDVPGFRADLQARLHGFIAGIVQDAIDEGLVRDDFDARRLTYVIINIVSGLAVLAGIEDEPFTRVDILTDSLKALVGGILTPTGAEAMRGSPLLK